MTDRPRRHAPREHGGNTGSSTRVHARSCLAIRKGSSLRTGGRRTRLLIGIPATGMERLWSLAGATSGNRWQIGRPRKRRNQAKTVATGCDQLPWDLDGKEGVDGSSPSEGSAKAPQTGAFSFAGTCTISSVRWIWSHLRSLQVDDEAGAIVELKAGSDRNALGPCSWDALKLSFLLQRGLITAGYLLATAPLEIWSGEARGCELFETTEVETLELHETFQGLVPISGAPGLPGWLDCPCPFPDGEAHARAVPALSDEVGAPRRCRGGH